MGYTQILSMKNPRQRRWDGALNLLVLCLCVHVCLCKPVCVSARVHVCVCFKGCVSSILGPPISYCLGVHGGW